MQLSLISLHLPVRTNAQALELVDALLPSFNVQVVTTTKGAHFFDKRALEAKGVRVWTDDDEWGAWKQRGDPVTHIELRRWAHLLLVAPLSANTLAKLSNGICDNLLTCLARAWDFGDKCKHLVVAPAMNTAM